MLLGLSDEGHSVVVSRLEGHRLEVRRGIGVVLKSLSSLVEGAVGSSIGPSLVVTALMSAVWDVEGTEISVLAESSALSLREIGEAINILLLDHFVAEVAIGR